MPARWLGLACLLSLLTGCSLLPERGVAPPHTLVLGTPPERFHLSGRVAVRSGEQSFSGSMRWEHAPREDTLILSTPLGQGVAELHATPGRVSLKDADGRVHAAEDAESLVRQVAGMTLPLSGLSWWVLGHPRPDAAYTAQADAAGRLAVLHQDDWQIEFSRHAPQPFAPGAARQGEVELPGRLVARRGEELELRLVVDQWHLP